MSGQHYLTGEMIRKYVLKLMENDRKITPFKYIQSEQKIHYPMRLTDGTEIQLKGFIDRLDEVNGTTRIIDYKTGAKKGFDFKSIENLFDSSEEERRQAIMQVFMYAWMMQQLPQAPPKGGIQPTLYYVRDFFTNDFDPVISYGKEKAPVIDFSVYQDEFEDCMRYCLDQMFDPSIPFTQAIHTKYCAYCPFAGICGRN